MRRRLLFVAVALVALAFDGPAPVPADDAVCFAAASDQHYGFSGQPVPANDGVTVEDWMSNPGLPRLDFVIASLGDWISDNRAVPQWADVTYAWEQITLLNADRQKIPYFFVIGNHDITNYEAMPADGNPVLKERLGRSIAGLNESNYAFMYDNVLFIGLAQTNVLYQLSHFQRSWVEYLLERYAEHTTVILTHQAMYQTTGRGDTRATSWTSNDYRVYNDVTWWHDLLASNPQVKLFLHGHNEKGYNTVAFDLHSEAWDDNCTFVLVPSNGRDYGQDDWSYVFTITDGSLSVQLWSSATHDYESSVLAGVPYERAGDFNVTDVGLEWLSIPKQVANGQRWTWQNRMVARQYTLELIGSNVVEQIDNPELEGCHESDEDAGERFAGYWYAVRGDEVALNKATGEQDGFILMPGGNVAGLAASPAGEMYVEGKVPYNTALAIPGKTYRFEARIATTTGTGTVDFLISIPRQLTLSDYVWYRQPIAVGIEVSEQPQDLYAEFTIPDDETGWFIQPEISFDDASVTYIWDRWSLQMLPDGDLTEDFAVTLNGQTLALPGPLAHHQYAAFPLAPTTMDNTLQFECDAAGNHVGMVRLIYEQPQLWSDDVSFGIRDEAQTQARVEDVSPFNAHTTIMSFDRADWGIIDPGFTRSVVRGKMLYRADANDDTINATYALGVVIPGDLDCDADVDLIDLATLLGSYGQGPGGDVDGDGDTDLDDLMLLLENYGRAG